MRRISGEFAYLMRALVDFSHLGGSKAPGRNERRPERELKRELLLKPLRALRQGQEQFLRLGQVGDRFEFAERRIAFAAAACQ